MLLTAIGELKLEEVVQLVEFQMTLVSQLAKMNSRVYAGTPVWFRRLRRSIKKRKTMRLVGF